jgi:hypothetical protein
MAELVEHLPTVLDVRLHYLLNIYFMLVNSGKRCKKNCFI